MLCGRNSGRCHTYDNNLVILLEEILFASSEGGFPPGWLGYEAVVGGYIRGGLANRLQHFEPVLFTSNNTLFHENKDHAGGPVVGPPLPRLPPRPRQGQDGMHTVAHRKEERKRKNLPQFFNCGTQVKELWEFFLLCVGDQFGIPPLSEFM